MNTERCGAKHPRADYIVCRRVKDHENLNGEKPERHMNDKGVWWTDEEEAVA